MHAAHTSVFKLLGRGDFGALRPTWLSPCDFVLDGDPAPSPKRGGAAPIFGPRLLWPSGCMDQNATWYVGRPRFTRRCVRRGTSSPSPKGAQFPNYRPMSVAAKRLDGLRCHLVWK